LKSKDFFVTALLAATLVSCGGSGLDNVAVAEVVRKDFVSYVDVDGYTEPVSMTAANCPSDIEGTIAWIVEDGVQVNEGDVVCRIEVPTFQTDLDNYAVALESARASLETMKASFESARAVLLAQVKENEAQASIAGLDSLQLSYMTGNEARIKRLEMRQTEINQARYAKKLAALEKIQQSELKKAELEIRQYERWGDDLRERIASLVVKAPKNGLAVRQTSWISGNKLTVGDQVWSRMPIVSIPDVANMKIKISVPEMDFKNINTGDSVVYAFDAMPNNEGYGRITMKSPVGSSSNVTTMFFGGGMMITRLSNQSKVKFFEMEASIDSVAMMPEPGFSARCRVFLQQVRDTLVIPQIAVFDADSAKVVYVRRRNGFEMREIKSSLSSLKELVVSKGLQAGETIALVRPPARLIKNPKKMPNPADAESATDSIANPATVESAIPQDTVL
jgi:multidrug efflux pump subunit AcrA (membrane-fusion protein)